MHTSASEMTCIVSSGALNSTHSVSLLCTRICATLGCNCHTATSAIVSYALSFVFDTPLARGNSVGWRGGRPMGSRRAKAGPERGAGLPERWIDG